MDDGTDVIAEMMAILQEIQDGGDLHPTPELVRDGFLKVGLMLCVASGVPIEKVVEFVALYHAEQCRFQCVE